MAELTHRSPRLNTRRLVQRRGEMTTTAIAPSSSLAFQGGPGSGTALGEVELQSVTIMVLLGLSGSKH